MYFILGNILILTIVLTGLNGSFLLIIPMLCLSLCYLYLQISNQDEVKNSDIIINAISFVVCGNIWRIISLFNENLNNTQSISNNAATFLWTFIILILFLFAKRAKTPKIAKRLRLIGTVLFLYFIIVLIIRYIYYFVT